MLFMISWSDVNSLQKEKLNKEIKLKELLKSNSSEDEINELKSEILYLNKQIEKIVGTNEIKRQKEIRIKKLGLEEKKLNNYYAFKEKYKKISKMRSSVKQLIKVIDIYNNSLYIENENELVRLKR